MMLGNLYKTKMGWVVKYPINNLNRVGFNTTIIPVDNYQELTDSYEGVLIPFSIKIKKSNSGKIPYAKINLN